MKEKALIVAFCILFVLACPVQGMAEAADAVIDWTPVVERGIALVAAVVLVLITFVWRRWIQPWLKRNNLMDAAEIVVTAVEALIGRGNGEKKWALALEKMQKEYGFDINDEAVLDALRKAWKELDLSQLLAGEKWPTEPPDTGDAAGE